MQWAPFRPMPMTVFVQNEAGSNRKHYHNEKTLELQRAVDVSERYPFPYGFVVGTTAEDGCNVDCYIISGDTADDCANWWNVSRWV